MFGLDKITPGKVLKAVAVAGGVGAVALIAPIGVAGVVGLTAASAAASWAADSVGDELNGKNKEDS